MKLKDSRLKQVYDEGHFHGGASLSSGLPLSQALPKGKDLEEMGYTGEEVLAYQNAFIDARAGL